MSFLIHFQYSKKDLNKPVNLNIHDCFYWDFAHEVSEWSRLECGADEKDWLRQKTIHDLYEIYNAPHKPEDQRSKEAAYYIVDKEFALISEGKIDDPDSVKKM